MPVRMLSKETIGPDIVAGLVVFLVALPLCLGIALASGAPLFSGIVAGIVGGLVVGAISRSHTSVSGPAAGLTAVVLTQISAIGSFKGFLVAVFLAGILQIGLGFLRAGQLSAYVPTSVIKGLLAAIGVILILKQIPHLLGHDTDVEGEMSFRQPDRETTFSELWEILGDVHPGAAAIGLTAIAILISWERVKVLKNSLVPAPLIVVLLGAMTSILLRRFHMDWKVAGNHLVQVPVSETILGLKDFIVFPDFTALANPALPLAAVTIALVASLETLLNLEAIDKLDPYQRSSPPNRELIAQGVGNMVCGSIGGIPVTSVIIRSSVNINAGGKSRLATLIHGALLLLCVALLPTYLNTIPLSCLAAILIVTGFKLASPQLLSKMWKSGWNQFAPFVITVLAIVFTDLLIGVIIGLVSSTAFILHSNLRRPLRRIVEKHLAGDVLRIEFANQVSFLNRASIDEALNQVPRGGHLLLDARQTVYFDPDVLQMITDFKEQIAPARNIHVSLVGFQDKYTLSDEIQFVDYSSRDVQANMTPQQVLQVLQDGNERFRTNRQLSRDYTRQLATTALGQYPLAVVLSCIDSRTPAELIFDLGIGDIFSVRLAGNICSARVLGSIEYGCAVAGAKLILVVGHTRCGAVTSAVTLAAAHKSAVEATGCEHIDYVTSEIQKSLHPEEVMRLAEMNDDQKSEFIDSIAKRHVMNTVHEIVDSSKVIQRLIAEGRLDIVGGLYNISTGRIEFMTRDTTVA